jgi:hypothetical protein
MKNYWQGTTTVLRDAYRENELVERNQTDMKLGTITQRLPLSAWKQDTQIDHRVTL